MFRLIIFDFDGPILDSFGVAKKMVYKTSEALKLLPPSDENFILNWGYPGTLAIERMFPGIAAKKVEIFVEAWAENERKNKLPLVPGAKETLKEIKKQGLLTALLTTRSHNLKLHFNGLGLEGYFDFFQSFDNILLPKEKVHPNHVFHSSKKDEPGFFDKLFAWMKNRNISLKEAIFIDDTLAGLRLAMQTGLPFLGVCTGPVDSKAKWLKYGNLGRKYVIKSIAELPVWLKKHTGM